MKLDESIRLVIKEATGEKSIPALIHSGDFPAKERMNLLNQALKIIFAHSGERNEINRKLAEALFTLSFHIQGEIDGQLSRKREIPKHFIEETMVEMFLIIESIFTDENIYE